MGVRGASGDTSMSCGPSSVSINGTFVRFCNRQKSSSSSLSNWLFTAWLHRQGSLRIPGERIPLAYSALRPWRHVILSGRSNKTRTLEEQDLEF